MSASGSGSSFFDDDDDDDDDYDDNDDDDDEKECVMEAPANEDNELDTLLLLGQVSNNKISLFITMINILVS